MKFMIYLIQYNNAESMTGVTSILTEMGAYQSPGDAIEALEKLKPGMTDEKYVRPDSRDDVEINFTYYSILRLELHGFEERIGVFSSLK